MAGSKAWELQRDRLEGQLEELDAVIDALKAAVVESPTVPGSKGQAAVNPAARELPRLFAERRRTVGELRQAHPFAR